MARAVPVPLQIGDSMAPEAEVFERCINFFDGIDKIERAESPGPIGAQRIQLCMKEGKSFIGNLDLIIVGQISQNCFQIFRALNLAISKCLQIL